MRRHTWMPLAALVFAACATSPADDSGGAGGGGGGGKADDTESSCPVDGGPDKIQAAIEGGGSCYVAAGIAEACAWGSSVDVQFVAAATDVCSSGFGAMSSAVKAEYEGLLARCAQKYADEAGTLYLAMTAFCQLEVTQLYNTLYPEPSTSDPAVPFSRSCPIAESDPDKVERAIAAARSCGQAADLAESCAWGSSIDVGFVATASEVCAANLSAADQALRDRLYRACADLYAGEEGTLVQSMTAFCGLQVDVVFDGLYAPVQ